MTAWSPPESLAVYDRPGVAPALVLLATAFGLLTGTPFASGQTSSPTAGAQAPAFPPPSGVLNTAPLAPVAVPPSGVLVTPPMVERHATVTTVPTKAAQTVQIANSGTHVTMRRHVVHQRSAARRATIARTTIVDQGISAAPSVVSTAAVAQPPDDGGGYELFLSQIGKGKELK